MRRSLVTLVVVLATVGCTLPNDVFVDFNSTSRSSLDGGGTQLGATINGVMWSWNVSWSDVKDTPDWLPGEEPPISMPKAIEIAQAEMTKYADSPDAYELDGVQWLAINQCCKPHARKWIYVVDFERKERFENGSRGTIRIPILLDGRAIAGVKEAAADKKQ
jgi:hypothetical protein